MSTTVLLETPESALISIMATNEQREIILSATESALEEKLVVRPDVVVYGKPGHEPRNVGFFSDAVDEYVYSRKSHKSKKMTDPLRALLLEVNKAFGAEYNAILVNEYVDGRDNIGPHSDNKEHLDDAQGVVAISVGVGRKFRVRNKKTKEKRDFVTRDCEFLQMRGKFQEEFTHEIPPELTIKKKRISLTFRKHEIKINKK